jgi:hypothetical protein
MDTTQSSSSTDIKISYSIHSISSSSSLICHLSSVPHILPLFLIIGLLVSNATVLIHTSFDVRRSVDVSDGITLIKDWYVIHAQ